MPADADADDLPAPVTSSVEERARESLLRQAESAASQGQLERYDALMSRLDLSRAAEVGADPAASGHQRDFVMTAARLTMAAVLVLGLIIVVIYAIASGDEVGSAQDYIPLVSGLAGIAIGWLYGGSRSSGDD